MGPPAPNLDSPSGLKASEALQNDGNHNSSFSGSIIPVLLDTESGKQSASDGAPSPEELMAGTEQISPTTTSLQATGATGESNRASQNLKNLSNGETETVGKTPPNSTSWAS